MIACGLVLQVTRNFFVLCLLCCAFQSTLVSSTTGNTTTTTTIDNEIYVGCGFDAVPGRPEALQFCNAYGSCFKTVCDEDRVFSKDHCGCVPIYETDQQRPQREVINEIMTHTYETTWEPISMPVVPDSHMNTDGSQSKTSGTDYSPVYKTNQIQDHKLTSQVQMSTIVSPQTRIVFGAQTKPVYGSTTKSPDIASGSSSSTSQPPATATVSTTSTVETTTRPPVTNVQTSIRKTTKQASTSTTISKSTKSVLEASVDPTRMDNTLTHSTTVIYSNTELPHRLLPLTTTPPKVKTTHAIDAAATTTAKSTTTTTTMTVPISTTRTTTALTTPTRTSETTASSTKATESTTTARAIRNPEFTTTAELDTTPTSPTSPEATVVSNLPELNCDPELNITGMSSQSSVRSRGLFGLVHIGNRGVASMNGSAHFNGRSFLWVPLYEGARFISGLTLILTIQEDTTNLSPQGLINNCGNELSPSFSIVLEPMTRRVKFKAKVVTMTTPYPLQETLELNIPYTPGKVKVIEFQCDGRKLIGRVDWNQAGTHIPSQGHHELVARMKPLYIGKGCRPDNVDNYRGQIYSVSVFRCVRSSPPQV